MKKRKRILILHTGGTIGMGDFPPNPSSHSSLKPNSLFVRRLKQEVPELWEIAHVEVLRLSDKDSSQLTPKDWVRLHAAIVREEDAYDGFVITHGTDTMAYSATALSYLLPLPYKPVVFTGSQRPLGELRTDARRNLINAVGIAADQWICEVSIFFDTVCLRGNRAKKMQIQEFEAFQSPNFPVLAQDRLRPFVAKLPRESLSKPSLEPIFETRIQVLKLFPGIEPKLDLRSKALVLEGFGCGNLPLSRKALEKLFLLAKRRHLPIILCSQVPGGALAPEIYEAGRTALELGALSAGDMTFEAALVKTMLLAGNEVPLSKWRETFEANWAGERMAENV